MKLLATLRWVSLVVLAVVIILGAAIVLLSQRGSLIAGVAPSIAGRLDQFGPAPRFRLTDQLNRPVDAADLLGKTTVVNFIYTHCPDICPLRSAQMQQLQAQLRAEGLLGHTVQLLSISIDPARDTTEVLRTYASTFQADPDAWRFLRGTEAETRVVVVNGFKLGVEILEVPQRQAEQATNGHSDHYEVAHSGSFVLIDPNWHIRAYYDGATFDAAQILADIRQVSREPGR